MIIMNIRILNGLSHELKAKKTCKKNRFIISSNFLGGYHKFLKFYQSLIYEIKFFVIKIYS